MTWTLTWKGTDGPQPIDGSVLLPDTLGQLSRESLAATVLSIGRSSPTLADLFEIEGEPSNELLLRNLPCLDRLGAGMASGRLIVEGDAGDDLGASMSGGQIIVNGNAGDRVGGPNHGSSRGMTGGEIVVKSNAGDHVGHLMRRGLIAVGGTCGNSPGFRMLAGSLVIAQGPLDHPGLEMQRGTIICLDNRKDTVAESLGDHLCEAGVMSSSAMPAVSMVIRRAKALINLDAQSINQQQRVRLWHGDRFEMNKGEVIQWLS